MQSSWAEYRTAIPAGTFRRGGSLLSLFLLAACSGKVGGNERGGSDSAAAECEYGIRYEGPDEPQVGDEWEVWLTCDGQDTGVMIIRIYPGELATIDGRMITFLQAGTGKLRLQSGAHRATMDVTVFP